MKEIIKTYANKIKDCRDTQTVLIDTIRHDKELSAFDRKYLIHLAITTIDDNITLQKFIKS